MSELETRYQEAINQGHSAAWDQEWERAASFYRQAITDKPEDPYALTSLALALFELQDFEESLKYYLRVVELSPKDPVPIEKAATLYEILKRPEIGSKIAIRAAELYLNSGDIEKAIENWTRAVGMNPEDVVAHSRLAVVYERLGRIPKAVREYLHIASLMQHLGEKDKAAQVINRALKLSPNNEEAAQALTMLRENVPLPKPARPRGGTGPIKDLPEALLPVPEEKPDIQMTPIQEAAQKALEDLATLFFEQSSEESEEQQTRTGGLQAIVDGTGPLIARNVDKTKLMLHLGQAVEYLTHGENEHAATDLKRAIDIGLHHPAAYYRLGMIRAENDRSESAIRYLKRSVSHAEYALGSRLLMAEGLHKKGQIKEASIEYLEALSLADAQVVPRAQSDGLRQLYEPVIETHTHTLDDNRCEHLCKTIADILNRPDWRQNLKKIRNELVPSDSELPVPLAEVLTEASSSLVVVAMSGIRQLAREGHRQAAFEEALFALQNAPTYLPLHIAIGDLLVSNDQIEAAIEKFQVVARSYSVRGETGRAVEMYRRVVDMSPMDLDARTSLIDQLVSRGQSEDAIKEYIKMAEVYYRLAELSGARKTYTRALRFAEQASLGETWRVRILHRIADIDLQSLNWRQALIIYQQICGIRPDDLDANQRLIDLNFRLGERKQAIAVIETFIQGLNTEGRQEEVVSFLETLSREWPQQAVIRDYLANQYQALGRIDEAIDQLDTAREIFLDTGNKSGAISVIQKVIDLNPADVDKYRQLLERIQSN
jgi:tetratricopeptide (TPR) repeat protein